MKKPKAATVARQLAIRFSKFPDGRVVYGPVWCEQLEKAIDSALKRAAREAALLAERDALREAVRVLGQEVEYSRLVLNEVKKQRTYEAANRLVPGGCVSSAMETYCARLIAGRVLVDTNPLASAAVRGEQQERKDHQ